jgi:epoxyqueuosine reductase QueG
MRPIEDDEAKDLTHELKGLAQFLGAVITKVAPVARWDEPPPFDAEGVPVFPHTGLRPDELLPGAQSVVVVAVRYLDGLMEHLVTGCRTTSVQANFGYVHLNRKLHQITFRLAEWLEECGHRSLPLGYNIGTRYDPRRDRDARFPGGAYGMFSMKRAAVLAGAGRVARNGLVSSPEFGPRIRLGALVTTAGLAADPLLAGHPCPPGCDICARVCSTDAIGAGGRVDHLRCYADSGRRGTRYDAIKRDFKKRYPLDSGDVDYTVSDLAAIDGGDPRFCRIACMVFCPLGAHKLPDVWQAAKDFHRTVQKVALQGFPD